MEGAGRRRGWGMQSPPSRRGSCCPTAAELRACGTTGPRTSFYSPIYYSQNSRRAQKMPSLPFLLMRKLTLMLSFSCVKPAETGPKYKQNICVLYLFSTTCKAQDLIINGS